MKNGTDAYNRKLYNDATELLIKEFGVEKNDLIKQQKAMLIADAFKRNNKPSQAEQWYKTAAEINGTTNAEAFFRRGQMQKMLEQYDSAIVSFTKSDKLGGGFPTRKEIRISREAIDWKKAFTRYNVINLEQLNTAASDFATTLQPGKLIFTSSRNDATGESRNGWTGEKFGDLYIAERSGRNFSNIRGFSPQINSNAYEGTATFSTDGKELYFTRCGSNSKANDFCHIYYSTFDGTVWSAPVKVELFPDTINVGHPCLSKDGKLLVVSAQPENSFGGKDIYYFSKSDTGWSRPVNASSNVNTTGDDMYPWLDEKNNLYFASNGWPGMGGLDIFKATRLKTGWKDATNLRSPINSGADDFAFIKEKSKPIDDNDTILSTGYFSSSRDGGKGNDDIYRYEERWINLYRLQGKVFAKIYEDTTNHESKVLGIQPLRRTTCDLKDSRGNILGSIGSDSLGRFQFDLSSENDYVVSAIKNGYFSSSKSITTRNLKNRDTLIVTIYTELELDRIFTSKEIVIPNIYYDYDKASLRPESILVLDSLISFFNSNPGINIEIGSHTDSRGSDEYNLKLSQARAESVVNYLTQKSIARERLQAKGYGETRPVNNCVNNIPCTEDEHMKNRRTTFRVVSSKFILESIEPVQIKTEPKPEDELEEEDGGKQ